MTEYVAICKVYPKNLHFACSRLWSPMKKERKKKIPIRYSEICLSNLTRTGQEIGALAKSASLMPCACALFVSLLNIMLNIKVLL